MRRTSNKLQPDQLWQMELHFLNLMIVIYASVKYGTEPQKFQAVVTKMARAGL